jgi:hypothetical protein
MVDVKFEDQTPQSYASFLSYRRVKRGLVGFVFRIGFADTEREAEQVLIGVVVSCIIISTSIILIVKHGPRNDLPSKEKIEQLMGFRVK